MSLPNRLIPDTRHPAPVLRYRMVNPSPGAPMRYQFTIQPTRTAGRGKALLFAACGDRNPDRASAGEPVVVTPSPTPAPTPRPVEPQPTTPADFFRIGRT